MIGQCAAGNLGGQVAPASQNVGQVVLDMVAGVERRALVIERIAVGLHVIEPDLIGAAAVGLGKKENHRQDPGIGLKDDGGHGDKGVQLLLLHQQTAQGLVRIAGAKEDAIRHNHRRSPPDLNKRKKSATKSNSAFLVFTNASRSLAVVS